MSDQLATRPDDTLATTASAAPANLDPATQIAWQHQQIQRAMDTLLSEGKDYGIIKNKKGEPIGNSPGLFKSGAEVLLKMFDLRPRFDIHQASEIDVAAGRVDLIIEGTLEDRDGHYICNALAAGSSHETKWQRPHCPNCGDSVFYNGPPKGSADDRPDWKRDLEREGRLYTCRDRGCGWGGESAPQGFSPDQFNTLIKMVEKRAKVALALTGTAASHFFTQDIEDMPTAATGTAGAPTPSTTSKPVGGASEPTCPVCGSGVYDNRASNKEKEAEGRKAGPNWKCRNKQCEGGNEQYPGWSSWHADPYKAGVLTKAQGAAGTAEGKAYSGRAGWAFGNIVDMYDGDSEKAHKTMVTLAGYVTWDPAGDEDISEDDARIVVANAHLLTQALANDEDPTDVAEQLGLTVPVGWDDMAAITARYEAD